MDRYMSAPRYAFDPISNERERSVSEIIQNFIPMGLKGLFYGDEKTFKTPVAVKIGVDVAMQNVTHHGDPGLPGLGYEILRHGAVRYIAAELPKGVHSRAREFIRARDPNADPEKVDFKVLSAKPDLTNPNDVDELIKALDSSLGFASPLANTKGDYFPKPSATSSPAPSDTFPRSLTGRFPRLTVAPSAVTSSRKTRSPFVPEWRL